MKYKAAKIFSSGTEYEMFKYNYCENGCIHHVEGGDGFPDVLLEVWDGECCINWHHCSFYAKKEGGVE